MNNKNTLFGVVALFLVVGFGLGYVVAHQREGAASGEIMDHSMTMTSMMDSMTAGLSGKTGDAFDQAFIEEMIVHHQGAVDMATLALVHAKHDEIKTLASAIITAQMTEIAQMQSWLAEWYGK